jgi:hypothetical protein
VAGVTRARALLSRRAGAVRTREVAGSASLPDALRLLAAGPYRRRLDLTAGVEAAQRAIAATLLWHLRVLAGWQPRTGATAVRLLASDFETANVEDLLRSMSGSDRPPAYELGALATAWPSLSRAGSPAELRASLAASAWGDPGAESPAAVGTGMRLSAALRTVTGLPQAAGWAAGATALLVARETFLLERRLTEPLARRAAGVLGPQAVGAGEFAEFKRRLSDNASWALDGVDEPAELWRSEARWWTRVESDGFELLRGSRFDVAPVVGTVAVLSADAWRVRAALELAARGGGPLEVFDALV